MANCADFAELLVSQDASRYEALVAAQQARLAALDQAPASALRDYARAEITLHLGLNQLLFKHVVVGGYHLRSGFHQMQAVVKRYPAFAAGPQNAGHLPVCGGLAARGLPLAAAPAGPDGQRGNRPAKPGPGRRASPATSRPKARFTWP